MMRISKIWPAAILAALTIPLPAVAQQVPQTPPVLEKLEEGEAPAITIRKQDDSEKKTTEKRDNSGKVTEIKVQSGGSTYYLKPNDPVGSAAPGDAQSSSMRPAQWKILEFDLGGKKTSPEVDTSQTPAPPPAPEATKK